ncbi:ATPase [Paenibacillus mucilaginosus 3016]|uniref:ATPase n=1 Tax=Paenibacillus mucilaginosus 3016 TaxID=1116391 RepID=H6NEM8_9BACL|nr:MoxR family ATPase [Paenibacillus mucilaginosus]AFC28332.1 ATPase [Paenibacillus mucilaginosus 3016]WFA17134.1 MoxR family ATPase [Paenibacillus mucilaginosus]
MSESLQTVRSLADRVRTQVNRVIVGKEDVIDRLLIALFSSGHVLLEDVPGTGKTLLAKALAHSVGVDFKRIQFTPDLLPSDLSGIHFYNQRTSEFEFRPGPLFTNLLLADEINRATPRTQSSLLECMEERQISIDGTTHRLRRPFLVIATQNPVESQGTFPLPEAQLDRFLLKIRMGYPSHSEGLQILKRFRQDNPLEDMAGVASAEDITEAQSFCAGVTAADDVLAYLLSIVEATREHGDVAVGVSPRGSQALLRASQVHAVLRGRDFVTPDDIKALALPVLAHRIVLKPGLRVRPQAAESLVSRLLEELPVPAEPSASAR